MKKNKTIAKIMISGYYGFNNTGDEAILTTMVRDFKEKIPQIKIVTLSNKPLQTSQFYDIDSINRLNLIKILSCLRDTNLFISGGGGLLQDSTGKGWSILYYLGLILIARIFSVPIIIYAQGIGPINKQINRKLVKWILNKVDLITVRDSASKELLENLGIINSSIYVNSDAAFLLKKRQVADIINKYPHIKSLICSNNCSTIGISVRDCNEENKDLKRVFAKLADDLIEHYKVKVVFLPFKFNEDVYISEEIISLMKNKNQIDILKTKLEPEELLSLLPQFSLMVGVRLHSIIFSAIANIPFIAINYDPKVKNFVENLCLPELLLELENISLKTIKEKIKYIKENKDNINKILLEKTVILEEKARSNNELVFKLLKL